MTTKRLATLLAVVAIGMGGVFLLPKSAAQPTGINLALPEKVAGWTSRELDVTQKEKDTLGKGTEFGRRVYFHPIIGNYDVLVSLVLSGHDMSNSIHRPERCLTAQGWEVVDSEQIAIAIEGKGMFKITRLHNRRIETDKDGKPIEKQGKPYYRNAYSYYWFVGEDEITASHWGRFFQDNKDRLFRGVNQRWAFITVTASISVSTEPEPEGEAKQWTDKTMRDFLREIAPSIHKDTVRYK